MSAPDTRPKGFDPLTFVQRLLVVTLLVVGIVLLHQFAVPGDDFDPRAMLSLGFVILAAYTIGELATSVGIPHITGYLLSGVLFGPSLPEIAKGLFPDLVLPPPLDGGILSRGVLGQLGPIDALALALIALSAGGELEVDELRKSWRYVVGSTVGMVTATVGAVFAFLVVLTQAAPATIPGFGGVPLASALVLCAIIATLAAATSPAVSIAVVHSTGARGPVSSTVLTGVVLGEIVLVVFFSAVTSLLLPILGGGGTVTVSEALLRVVASAGTGLVAGVVIAFWLRAVAVDLLLFLVGAIYLTTFGVQSFSGEPAVAFIAAGLVVGNAHRLVPASGQDLGRTLLSNVERMSRPVFAVFFALAGAKLHLDVFATLAVPATAIFTVRALATRYGTTLGARLSGAPPSVERWAWTGFISQAGLAIALASQARSVLPESVRDAVYSIALAVVAVCEVVGPSMLQSGLRAAGEIPEGGASTRPAPDRARAAPGTPSVVPRWPTPEHAPWPLVPTLDEPELEAALGELDRGLLEIVDQEIGAPVEGLGREAETWVRVLRQQWGRHLRPTRWTRLHGDALATALRRALADALDASVALVRAFDPKQGTDRAPFVAAPLVERIDALVAALPSARTAPVPASFLAPRAEPMADRVRRATLRSGARLWGARRSVSLRDLARFHLSGGVPAALEPVLSLVPHARAHVADRTSETFVRLTRAIRARAAEAARGEPTDEVLARVVEDLRAADAAVTTIIDELGAISVEGTERGRAVLARLADRLYVDVERAGTFALSSGGPRYAPRFRERSRTTHAIAASTVDARRFVESRYEELLLELEFLSLRVRTDVSADTEARALDERFGRQVVAGLAQVDLDLDRWIGLVTDVIDRSPSHEDLSARLGSTWDDVREQLRVAIEGLRSTAEHLGSGAWIAPTTAALENAQSVVSPAHLLGVRRAPADRIRLPASLPLRTVDTGAQIAKLVESRVLQPLRNLGEELVAEVNEALATAVEVERVTQFNVELARSELELLTPDGAPDPELREQLRSMLVAAPHRVRMRLRQRREGVADRDGTLAGSVLSILDTLADLDRVLREGNDDTSPRVGWIRALPARVTTTLTRVRDGVGEDRWQAFAYSVGLSGPPPRSALTAALRPPAVRTAIPPVYSRLFSDLPFEAGELVAGRRDELAAVREALSSGLRSAAVHGIDPHGARALVSAAVGVGRHVHWFDADGPCAPGTVASWLDPLADASGQVFVVENLRWLFRREPGGMVELESLARRVRSDGGRNQWVLVADSGVWNHLAESTSLRDAMGAAVELPGLTVGEMQRAIESRHAMSGYRVRFTSQKDLVFRARRALARGTDEEKSRGAWFETLHRASGGVLQDAMRLWLAAVEDVDDDGEVVALGVVPRPPVAHLAALDDDWMQILLEARRQGWTDPVALARLFRLPGDVAESRVAQLAHVGLLVPHRQVWKIAPHLRGPVELLLRSRRWT